MENSILIDSLLQQKPDKLDLYLKSCGKIGITGVDGSFVAGELRDHLVKGLNFTNVDPVMEKVVMEKHAFLDIPVDLPLQKEANKGVVVDLYEVDYPHPASPDDETRLLEKYLDHNEDFVTQYLFPGSETSDIAVGLRENLVQRTSPKEIYKKQHEERGGAPLKPELKEASNPLSDFVVYSVEKLDVSFPHSNSYARLKPSPFGVGVFAIRDIPAGTIIFPEDKHSEMIEVPIEHLKALAPDIQQLYEDFCPPSKDGKSLICPKSFENMSLAWYVNHSDNANLSPNAIGEYVPNRDIKAGEELTANYAHTRSVFKNEQMPSAQPSVEELLKKKISSEMHDDDIHNIYYDMRNAFYAGREWVWGDLEQTEKVHKYDEFEDWYKSAIGTLSGFKKQAANYSPYDEGCIAGVWAVSTQFGIPTSNKESALDIVRKSPYYNRAFQSVSHKILNIGWRKLADIKRPSDKCICGHSRSDHNMYGDAKDSPMCSHKSSNDSAPCGCPKFRKR